MASNEIHELAVRVTPEGMDDTQDKLQETSEQFEETSEDVSESTSQMSAFAKKFRGAGLVFGAAFGGIVGAIASKMPLVEQTFTRLDILTTQLALQIDEDLRPATENQATAFQRMIKRGEDANSTLDLLSAWFAESKGLQTAAGRANAFSESLDDIAVSASLARSELQRFTQAARRAGQESAPAGREGRRRFRESDPATGPTGGGGGSGTRTDRIGGGSSRTGIPTGGTTFEVNLDSQTLAKQTKPFTVTGALNGGRGSRLG